MGLIGAKDQDLIRKKLAEGLKEDVRIIHFTQQFPDIWLPEHVSIPPCPYCRECKELIEEVATLSPKIHLEIHDLREEKELAEKYHVTQVPATIVFRERDIGIRFLGLFSGYEFASFLECLMLVSQGQTRLSADNRQKIKEKIISPLDIKVFVTPTCPHCPSAVYLAHQMAMESDYITATMIEATEFPEMANRFQVMGVPKTVINDLYSFEGALPESAFVDEVIRAQEVKKRAGE